jgi:hypothetical protein
MALKITYQRSLSSSHTIYEASKEKESLNSIEAENVSCILWPSSLMGNTSLNCGIKQKPIIRTTINEMPPHLDMSQDQHNISSNLPSPQYH